MTARRVWRWLQAREWRLAVLVYAVVTACILGPLLLPGFVLTLDMVFTPTLPLPSEMSSSYVFHAMLHMLNWVLPGDILQKIVLIAAFLLAGIGLHLLIVHIRPGRDAPWQWATYAAGIFYMVNPFVYSRLMAGQYAVLLGYALLPFFTLALLRFLQEPGLKRAGAVAAWAVGISIVSIHTLGLAIVIGVVGTATALWQWRKNRRVLQRVVLWSAGIALAVIALCSYWLIPALAGSGKIAESLQRFATADFAAFASDGGLVRLAGLQGFWADAQNLYTLPQDQIPLWGALRLLLWVVVGIGAWYAWRLHRPLVAASAAVGALGLLFALDTPLHQWLLANVPFFAGYREPHKFIALLALVFAAGFAFGSAWLLRKLSHRQLLFGVVSAMLVAFPFLYTPTLLWGAGGQLRPSQYPADWLGAAEHLKQEANGKVLFLPWHLYMPFGFSGRTIANPAKQFFAPVPVVTSNDPEFADVKPAVFDGTAHHLTHAVLPAAPQRANLGSQLRPLGITHVLLAKDADYHTYGYLDTQNDLTPALELPTLKLYKVTP